MTPLAKIKVIDDPGPGLILQLLDLDPSRRFSAFHSMETVFPDGLVCLRTWILAFALNIKGQRYTDELTIYAAIVGKSLLRERTVAQSLRFLKFYRVVFLHLRDP
jgi:hypothetical protein